MKTMTTVGIPEHEKLLRLVKRSSRPTRGFPVQKYLGTTHRVYNVAVPDLRKIVSTFSREHRDVSIDQFIALIDRLFRGDSREEKVLSSMMLYRFPDILKKLDAHDIDRWLGELSGWEEVDSFCDELAIWLLADLSHRLPILKKWAGDRQIEKRRASLVILCCAVRLSEEKKLMDLSFELIDRLKSEKIVMITKAISWLLRSLLKFHRTDVIEFLKKKRNSLPAIAVRETTKKLETGKK